MDIEMKKVEVEVAEEDEEEEEDEPCMALDDPEFRKPKPSTFRQQSVTARAKQRWGQVKRVIDDRAQTKKEVTEKWVNLTRSMSNGVSEFFGVSGAETDTDKMKEKWKARSRRLHHNTLIGGNKKEADSMDSSQMNSPHLSSYLGMSEDTLETGSASLRWNRKIPRPVDPLSRMHSRQISRISTASSGRRTLRTQMSRHAPKESVLKMTMDGIKHLARGISGTGDKSFVRSRSFAPSVRQSAGVVEEPYLDDVFFNTPAPTSAVVRQKPFFAPGPGALFLPNIHEKSESEPPPEPPTPSSDGVFNSFDSLDGLSPMTYIQQHMGIIPEKKPLTVEIPDAGKKRPEEPSRGFSGMRRVADQFIDATFVNTDRRQYGVGVVGVWLDRDYRKSRIDSRVMKQIEEMDDHRPYFTYWVTFVQVVIFIFTLSVYHYTYFGFDIEEVKEEVLRTSLSTEPSSYDEPQNMWFGPRQADLIHLGAKFSPCMRLDANVEKVLKEARDEERQSACCILNDGSGCFQASASGCSDTLSLWAKSSNGSNLVCGQDPRFCQNPVSHFPTVWSDDITQWPICYEPGNGTKGDRHMTCDIIGRPCCVGIHGQCIITTPDHCTFVKGFFHPEASLCSQVPCLNEVCGMIPFWNSSVPDQFYRLWTSLFLHAGLIQLFITVAFQVVVMRDLEKLAGWLRISIIYLGSGIAGSLSSAIFLPYHVEAGPTGSQFGLLACLFVEVIQSWQMLQHPMWAIGKLVILLIFLFLVGLFPWIDNYAHLIGFIFGFLLSFALFPHVTFNVIDERGKKIGIAICLIASIGLFIGLIIMFYVSPIYSCKYCQFFNCIPFTDNFCKSMEVEVVFKPY